MSIDDRIYWFAIGCIIGFFMGYITRGLKKQEELDDVEEIVIDDKQNRARGLKGLMHSRATANIALLFVIVLTAWAAFQSQRASNDVQDAQDNINRVTRCSQTYLSKTISALNERTTYTRGQASANVELQRAQAEMLGILINEPPYPEAQRDAAVRRYFAALTSYIEANGDYNDVADSNPYPSDEDFANCVNDRKSKE